MNSRIHRVLLQVASICMTCTFLWVPVALGSGAEIYQAKCAACHDNPTDPKVPSRRVMGSYYQSRVHDALTVGRMAPFVAGHTQEEIEQVVEHVTKRVPDPDEIAKLQLCTDQSISTDSIVSHWGLDHHNTRFQPNSDITASSAASLKLKWVFDVPESRTMRGYPAITDDTIFLPNTTGKLYALSRDDGCVKWHFDAEGEIRTAVHLFELNDEQVLSFGVQPSNLVVIRAKDGSLVHRENLAMFTQSMMTGSQRAHNGSLYVPISAFDVALAMNPMYECCESHGGVHAINLVDWSIRWTAHTTEDAKPTYKNDFGVQQRGPSGAPVWTTPAIDEKRQQLYIGTGENTSSPATTTSDAIIAYDLATGEEKWVFQGTQNDAFNMACGRRMNQNCPKEKGPDFDFGASPLLATTSEGVDLVLAGQKSGDVWALNPDTGELIWNLRLSPGSALGGVHWGMTLAGDTLVVPIADPDMVKDKNPGVFGIDIKSGELLWSHKAERGCEFGGLRRSLFGGTWPDCPYHYAFSAAPVATNDVAFAGSLNGQVFAFRVSDGAIMWSFDTKREFKGTNGGEAHGGSIDNPGVVVAGNQVMVLSGYDMFGQMPGNALLVFELTKATSTDS
ncbi:MAG: PQQ-binding-like beta-propeller repeat protein [Gammaproteobacteria bacterium]|nr:PQQ-binding-like beta-propeller repeat protein [Gammaproteobacteria bacterium]